MLLPNDCRMTARLNSDEHEPRVAEIIVNHSLRQPCAALHTIWLARVSLAPSTAATCSSAARAPAERTGTCGEHNAMRLPLGRGDLQDGALSPSRKHSSSQDFLERPESLSATIWIRA